MDIPEKVYRTLTAKERFRACVDAVIRNDSAEAARLYDTCPHKTYRMPDQDFAHPLLSLLRLTREHERELFRHALGFAVGNIINQMVDDGYDLPGQEHYERISGISADALSAKTQAWKEFCEEIGEDAEGLARAVGTDQEFPLRIVQNVLESLGDDAPTDGSGLREMIYTSYSSQLRDRWARITA